MHERLRQVVLVPAESSLTVLSGGSCFEFETTGALDLAAAWRSLERGRSAAQTAAALEVSVDEVDAFVNELRRVDLLTTLVDGEQLPRGEAIGLICSASLMWKRHSLLHPMLGQLASGPPQPVLLTALIVELCHYTRRIPDIARLAAQQARSSTGRELLSRYADDEAPHYKGLASGVATAMGATPSEVLAGHPSPACLALLALVEQLAHRGAPSFAAALCFLELGERDAPIAARDFAALASKNGLSTDAVMPVARHAQADGDHAHGDVGAMLLKQELPDPVSRSDLDDLLNGIHDLKHAFDSLYDELSDRWLDHAGPYELRRAVDSRLIARG